jgi:DNA polymerase-3 subunit epsilon
LRKLPLLAGLPRAAGVYLFRSGDGRVLHAGRAADVRNRARSLFLTGGRRRVARLLRETAAIEYLPGGHPLAAAVTQLRVHHAHRPWFDGRPRRWKACAYLKLTTGRFPRLAVVHSARADGALYLGPFQGVAPARFVRSAIEAAMPLRRGGDVVAVVRRGLGGEPQAILGPLAEQVEALAAAGRTGDAAFAREQLRALSGALQRQAVLDGLRASGAITLEVAGHHVELAGGRLVAVDGAAPPWPAPGTGSVPEGASAGSVGAEGLRRSGSPGRAEADEILSVGRWLRREARAGRVRVVSQLDAPAAAALSAALGRLLDEPD